jgi:hypothetical protein
VISGDLPAVTAVLALTLFFACEGKSYYAVPSIVLAKFYSNSLMVLFNTRIRIIGGRDVGGNVPSAMHVPLSSMHIRSNDTRHSAAPRLGSIHVQEEVWVEADEGTTLEEVSVIYDIITREKAHHHFQTSTQARKSVTLEDV